MFLVPTIIWKGPGLHHWSCSWNQSITGHCPFRGLIKGDFTISIGINFSKLFLSDILLKDDLTDISGHFTIAQASITIFIASTNNNVKIIQHSCKRWMNYSYLLWYQSSEIVTTSTTFHAIFMHPNSVLVFAVTVSSPILAVLLATFISTKRFLRFESIS